MYICLYIYIYMAVSILYLSFYNHKTITEQPLKFRVICYYNICVCRGCGLRRQKVFVFCAKSDLFVLWLIKMFAFVVGVACGAQQILYVTSKMTFSRYFQSWVTRRGKQLEHVCPKTMGILENVKRHQKPKFVLWLSCCFWCKDTK